MPFCSASGYLVLDQPLCMLKAKTILQSTSLSVILFVNVDREKCLSMCEQILRNPSLVIVLTKETIGKYNFARSDLTSDYQFGDKRYCMRWLIICSEGTRPIKRTFGLFGPSMFN